MTNSDKLLIKLGIYPNKLGYEYIKYAIDFFIIENSKDLNNRVYVNVALKFNTSVSNVERNIKSICQNSFVISRLNLLLNLESEYKLKKLTNSEFLTLLYYINKDKKEGVKI